MATSWKDPTEAAPEMVTFVTVGDEGAPGLAGGVGEVGAAELGPLCPVHAETANARAADKTRDVVRFMVELS
jgi:hypothetical protein